MSRLLGVSLGLSLLLVATPASAQSDMCWTCEEFWGCVLTNRVLIGYDDCYEWHWPLPEGCWQSGECYPWSGGIPASFDPGAQSRLSLKKHWAEADYIQMSTCSDGLDGRSAVQVATGDGNAPASPLVLDKPRVDLFWTAFGPRRAERTDKAVEALP